MFGTVFDTFVLKFDNLKQRSYKMTQIRVKSSKTGKIRNVKVDRIQDYIKSTGEQYSIASNHKGDQYKVIERDFDGAIFAKVKNA